MAARQRSYLGTATGGDTTTKGGTSSSGRSSARGHTSSSGSTIAKSGTSSCGGTTALGSPLSSGGGIARGGTSSTGGSSAISDAANRGGGSANGGTISIGGTTGTRASAWKIMPLGDSITNFCYPQDLSGTLTANGKTNFTFVGTQTANQGGCGTPSVSSVKTEGHGGYLVTYLTTNSPPQSGKGTLSELQTWAALKPDVVLLEMGTNDVWSNLSTSSITNA